TSTSVSTGTVNANTVNANNVTANNATVANSLTVNPGANVNFGGNQLHGVAAGVAPADAVNVGQLGSAVNTLNQRIDKANEGIAIAMSIQNPVLTGSDRFGVAVNWGDFAGNSAGGVAAVGILNPNVFGGGEKFGLTGGFGVSNSQVAG